MTTARLRPMTADELARWRRARAAAAVPLPEGAAAALLVEVDELPVGAALVAYDAGGDLALVRVLETTVPAEAGAAWAAVIAALEARVRERGVTTLATAIAPALAGVFGAAGYQATMTTVGKRLTPVFAPELQVDHRVAVRPMTDEERHRFAVEARETILAGMRRAGVVSAGSDAGPAELEAQLARIGRDPAPTDELLLTGVVDDVVVGRFWGTRVPHEDGSLDLFGNLVELLPEHRGQGLTKSFLGAIRRHLHELDIRDLQLRLYGYDTAGQRTFRTAGLGVADVHLRKDLA